MSAFDPADIAESRPRNHHKVEFIPAALQNVSVWGTADMKQNRQKICPFDSKVWSSIDGLSHHCLLKSRHSVARYEAVVASHPANL